MIRFSNRSAFINTVLCNRTIAEFITDANECYDGVLPSVSKPDLSAWLWYLKMDDGAGTNVTDEGTALKDGTTLGGGPAWATDDDMGGTVLDFPFETASAYVDIGVNAFNTVGTAGKSFTAACVIKPRTLGGAAKYPRLFYFGRYLSGSDRNGWYLDLDYGGVGLNFLCCNGGSAQTTLSVSHATAGIVANEICSIQAVFDNPNNEMRLYVNGINVGSASFAYDIGYHTSNYNRWGGASNAANAFDGTAAWAGILETAHDDAAALAFHNGLGL